MHQRGKTGEDCLGHACVLAVVLAVVVVVAAAAAVVAVGVLKNLKMRMMLWHSAFGAAVAVAVVAFY